MPCMKSLNILVRANPQDIFDFLCSKSEILDDFIVKDTDSHKQIIFIEGKLNWLSWGESITIEISKSTANENTSIIISSKPKVRTTFIDWGRNKQNVERIACYIYAVYPRAV